MRFRNIPRVLFLLPIYELLVIRGWKPSKTLAVASIGPHSQRPIVAGGTGTPRRYYNVHRNVKYTHLCTQYKTCTRFLTRPFCPIAWGTGEFSSRFLQFIVQSIFPLSCTRLLPPVTGWDDHVLSFLSVKSQIGIRYVRRRHSPCF